jgi:carboxypeptidase Taq
MLGVRMTFEEFYTAMNAIKLCFIRIESDEVTYCLHIIIRYELEKDLLRGKLDVKDLPRAWNRKYAEYLGVTPPTDAQGVLQDVHWSMGELGYFPTYALGTVYSAMLYAAMLRQHPLLEKELAQGKLQFVKDWLRENVHKHGASKLTPDIIRAACGKDLDAADFLQYLHKKYERM